MEVSTSLGRLFAARGVLDWEEMFPKGICNKCLLIAECKKRNCAALRIIGVLGANATLTTERAQDFAVNLRNAIDSIR